MDFEIYDAKPIFYNMKFIKSWLLSPDIQVNVFQLITKNFISTKDSWFPNVESYCGQFFKISSLVDKPYNHAKFPNEVLRVSTYILEEATYYERDVYNLVDLIGEMGGVIEVIVIVFGVIIYPTSK